MASVAPIIEQEQEESPLLRKYRISVEEYRRMGEANVFAPNTRMELIEGELIDMPPIGCQHAGKVKRLSRLLNRLVGDLAIVAAQDPVLLDDYSEPQPDISVLRPRADYYETAHPQPRDILLLVEVSDSSLPYDRKVKLPLYARRGIPEVWLINLPEQRVEVYRQPGPAGYREILRPTTEESIALSQLPDVAVNIADLFMS